MQVTDDVERAIPNHVEFDDAGIVEHLPSRAEVEGHVGVGEGLQDEALLPGGVPGPLGEVDLMRGVGHGRIAQQPGTPNRTG